MSIIEQIKALQAELTRLEGDVQRKQAERDRLDGEVQVAKDKAQVADDEVQVAEGKATIVKDKLELFSSVQSEYEKKFNAFIVEPFKTGGVLGDDIKSFADSCGFEFFDDEPEADEEAGG